jgi:hypothetical protein
MKTRRPVNSTVMPHHISLGILKSTGTAVFVWCAIVGSGSVCVGQRVANPSHPGTCETHSATLDITRNEVVSGASKDRVVIAIARLGDGETSRELNRRRLYNLRVHWDDYKLPLGTLVTAEGERVKGLGRIELYVAGKLFDMLVPKPGKDLCVDCCDPDKRLYPYRAVRRR